MNIAIIIAAGTGQRMRQDIPKQFLNVNDKPIIIYTLEAFQQHPNIDEIGVVCLEGWQDIVQAYAKQFKITKLSWIIKGGETGQASIRNGVLEAEKRYADDAIVLVHDAVRPMVSFDIISDCIVTAQKYGSAVAGVPCNTVVLKTTSKEYSKEVDPRNQLILTQTPQAFPLKKLIWAHRTALERGITDSIASCTLMVELGEKVYFSAGAETNIKLTTQGDMLIFKALLAVKEKNGYVH